MRIGYRVQGEAMTEVQFNYDTRVPPTIQHHRVRLFDGRYDVIVELRYRLRVGESGAQSKTVRRTLIVDGDGELELRLDEKRR